MKHLNTFEAFDTSKKSIEQINTIDQFIQFVNEMEKTPQRGFSYQPQSAVKIDSKTLLFHSSSEDKIKEIIETGFKGVGAYYSSFTKTRKSKEHIKSGPFGFAFDLTHKKVDSRYQKDFLYGNTGIIFTSTDACKVYLTTDKQNQVIFDVNSEIEIIFIVKPSIDPDNTKEWVWDIYDTTFNLIASKVKLKNFLKKKK